MKRSPTARVEPVVGRTWIWNRSSLEALEHFVPDESELVRRLSGLLPVPRLAP